MSKILVVFGATGQQGGSVIKSIKSDPKTAAEWKIRGISRDASKPNAQALTKQGVEMVTANSNSKESLHKAFEGAYAVFAVTDYWEKMDAKVEIEQGHNIADAAKASGIQHLIWSSLFDIKKLTGGKYPNVYHFDSKASVEDYIRELKIPSTFFMPGFYMSNIPGTMIRPSQQDPSVYSFVFPGDPATPIPLFDAANDTGKFVKAILTHRDSLLGERVLAASDYYTPGQIMEAFEKDFPKKGKGITQAQLPKDVYMGVLGSVGMPPHAQLEMYENMTFMHEFGYFGHESLDKSLALLDSKPTTLEAFFKTAPAFKDLE